MTRIAYVDDTVQIDAEMLARAMRISMEDLRDGMRDGRITSRLEKGVDEDAGRVRLTFLSADRRVRVVADEQGSVLTCSGASFSRPPPQGTAGTGSRGSAGGGDKGGGTDGGADGGAGGGSAGDGEAADAVERERRARLDAALDEALDGTFPASDPVAIGVDRRE